MSSETVHLLVLVHGMWGNPSHLDSLRKGIKERYSQPDCPKGPDGEQLEVLLAETNQDEHTYDGVDWGGERVAEEILAAVKRLEDTGKKVTRFSMTGYSLGGLVSRYAVGILHQRGFFENVAAVNFNTVATPHIGLPRYRTFISSVASFLGPTLLSRTGEQFWAVDKWSPRGRPLLEVMADPDRVFYQALCQFQHLRIYANAVHDLTVPYPSAAIEADDIFYEHMTNGIDIELDEQYAPLIKSYHLPDTPPPPPIVPKPLTREWFTNVRLPLPPVLQFKFPYNILVFVALPFIMPLFLTLVLTRLTLSMRASRRRLRLLEKEESSVDRLMHVIAKLERNMEDTMADMLDGPASPEPPLAEESSYSSAPPKAILATPEGESSALENGERPAKAERVESVTVSHPSGRPPTVLMTDLQLRLVRMLNTLPHLKKEIAFIHPVQNAHGPIICRDPKRFPSHKLGEGVVRHWADHFIF
ncbi:putative serine esterase-domain-containing protein [Fomitopsis serialis]|uniref:putative serine esterase-domain-containing protein n=1 Tax=Fomitopsis serialis TaxID=139415 RepID=UPI002008BAE5|nr:putative serine esterase-domain-containing protein [Neoantrodia serialis]KAH9908811.1 putative serine esterase-domain-containing protein [Neoantrodia serialis]